MHNKAYANIKRQLGSEAHNNLQNASNQKTLGRITFLWVSGFITSQEAQQQNGERVTFDRFRVEF